MENRTELKEAVFALTKYLSYGDTANALKKAGYKTPYGKYPSVSFINNVLNGNSLGSSKKKATKKY